MKLLDFVDFAELMKKFEHTERIELMEKKRVELLEKRFLSPWSASFYELNMTSMVWNISVGQLGLAAWLCSCPAPAHLLIS